MSKMGRVVFDIMEKYGDNIPKNYTLEDYFKEFWKDEERNAESKREKTGQESSRGSEDNQQTQEK